MTIRVSVESKWRSKLLKEEEIAAMYICHKVNAALLFSFHTPLTHLNSTHFKKLIDWVATYSCCLQIDERQASICMFCSMYCYHIDEPQAIHFIIASGLKNNNLQLSD